MTYSAALPREVCAGRACACAQAARQRCATCTPSDVAEHGGEGLLPVRIEALGQALQAAREVGIAVDAHAADRRRVVAREERQLREQAAERGAHAEVGFARVIERADAQAFALARYLQRERRRLERERDAAAVERRAARRACRDPARARG